MTPPPTPPVVETAFGDRYGITAVPGARSADGTHRAVVSVLVAEKGVPGAPSVLTLTPDEARALAAALVRWARYAEPEPCPCCGGAGWVYGKDDEPESVVCPRCDGSGKDR